MTFPPCSCGIKLTLFTKAYIDKMYPRKEAAIRQKKITFQLSTMLHLVYWCVGTFSIVMLQHLTNNDFTLTLNMLKH